MLIGVLNIELLIPGSNSLKTKRQAIRSVKDKLKNRFNVSVAEVDNTDKWQRSTLCIVTVSNEKKHIGIIFDNIMNGIYNNHRVEVINKSITFL